MGMARYISHVRCLYNSPRNDQPSAKTSKTSLTDLSLAIGTAYESIHTFVLSHEKSLIRDFRIFVISSSSSSSSYYYSSVSLEGRCEAANFYQTDLRWSEVCIVPKRSFFSNPTSRMKISGLCTERAILDSVPRLLRPRARVL